MNSTLEILEKLVTVKGISGRELPVAELAKSLLQEHCEEVTCNGGNVIGRVGRSKPNAPKLILDAHMDQVGFMVTHIGENGFLHVGNTGGLDYRLMPAQRVIIHGTQEIPGVIASIPPHLQDGGEHVLTVTELLIDTGLEKAELEQIVQQGDMVTFDQPFSKLAGDFVAGTALDDRCGMASILLAVAQLPQEKLPWDIYVLFSTQEETSERGAAIGGYTIEPDVVIAVDVTFGMAHGHDRRDCGAMGNGPMIGISPSLSRDLSKAFITCAKQEKIPYQIEVMSGRTGTNADRLGMSREGAEAVTVSIPLRYMHTPSEVISLGDVEKTAALLAAFVQKPMATWKEENCNA